MRKVLLFNMVSLDGFFEGANREIDWHVVDDEFNQYAIGQFSTVDIILFGQAIFDQNSLSSLDVSPGSLSGNKISIQDFSAEIV